MIWKNLTWHKKIKDTLSFHQITDKARPVPPPTHYAHGPGHYHGYQSPHHSNTPSTTYSSSVGGHAHPHPPAGHHSGQGCVIMLKNLKETLLTPDKLAKLASLFGNVARVKIGYTRRNLAFVQFTRPDMATFDSNQIKSHQIIKSNPI